MQKPILEVKNISKSFNGHCVLNNISLNLYPGETHLIIGENGAGKSTLMKIISGVYSPDEGIIYWEGEEVNISSPLLAHKLGITAIYQEPNLFPNLSITENLFVHNFINKFNFVKLRPLHQRSKEILRKYGIELDPHILVSNLGLAEKQMIEIIRALLRKSKVLIFDEATAALNENEFEIIRKLIKEVSELGVATFFVSQRLDYLSKIGDRVSVIRNGELIETKSTNRVSYQEVLQKMAGEPLSERYPKINVPKGEKVLQVQNLSNKHLLKDINFSIYKGEIVGLYGSMGSGRTLLGKTIFGLVPPSSGNILINGKKITNYNHRKALEHGLCYVPEDRRKLGLFLTMDIRENITIAQLERFINYGFINKKKEFAISSEYLRELAIKPEKPKTRVETLSGGNQQKLVLAKWFNMGAKIFILDEPTRGIDIASKSDVYNIINKLVISGSSILMISSDPNELVGMCDRILIIKKGTITAKLSRDDATVNKILELACN